MASTTFGKTIYKFSDLVNRTDNLVTRTDNLVTRTDNLDRKLVTKTDNLVKALQLASLGFVQVDTGVYFKELGERWAGFSAVSAQPINLSYKSVGGNVKGRLNEKSSME